VSARFDAALPAPPSPLWREALTPDPAGAPRLASYQPPGGEPIPFALRAVRFSGGQSRDAAEYPFGGLWSGEYLNEKPQALSVEGFLRGRDYIARRHALVEALRAPTGDGFPGHIELPFWGRFPVVVGDSYEVSERSDELGQCALTMAFTQAAAGAGGGALAGAPALESAPAPEDVEAAAGRVREAAAAEFEAEAERLRPPVAAVRAALGRATNAMLRVTGRVQAAQGVMDALTADIMGMLALAEQGILAPRRTAQAAFNAGASLVGAVASARNAAASYGDRRAGMPRPPRLPGLDDGRGALTALLSPGAFGDGGGAATPAEEAAARSVGNLCRAMALSAGCEIAAGMGGLTRGAALGYWALLEGLAEGICAENPAVHEAVSGMTAALSRLLASRGLAAEMARRVESPMPILALAARLGCAEGDLRRLNAVADSFVIEGEVTYV